MRKLNLISGALGLATLALTACSNEMPVDKNVVAEQAETRFLRVSIANTPSTRADETFAIGTEDENKVGSIMLKFFDASGNPLNDVTTTKVDGTDTGWKDNTGDPIPSVGVFKEAVMQVNIPRGTNFPSYVMCYINPVDYAADMNNKSMYELRSEERADYSDDSDNFAMTNSVYYGSNPLTGASQVKISATPILPEQLVTSLDAINETGEDGKPVYQSVEIYVERYAAKVNFTLNQAEGAIKDQTVGAYTLSFEPEMWSINADAPTMYVVKRFADNDAETTGIPSYAKVQESLGGWTDWNNANLHRSYWACSPGFYAKNFPLVSDNIIDYVAENPLTGEDAGNTTGAGVAVGDYALRYYSYNQITDASNNSEGFGKPVSKDGTNSKYVLENTMGKDAFDCQNPKAAAPSVIVVGSYSIKKGETEVTNPAGFYTYNSNLYYRETVPEADVEGKTIMDALLASNQILFTDQTGTLLNANASATVKNYFEVVHPSKAVRELQGNQPIPHRYVTLQLKSGLPSYEGLYYRPMGTDERRAVTAAVVDQLNLQLWSQLGVARVYNQNKGYFSIPIQHLGVWENTTYKDGLPPIENGVINWKNVRVGDFGLVRNHVYDIQVAGIDGMASGIDNLNNPLVPSMEENEYFVKYKINILNWRIVPVQNNIILK